MVRIRTANDLILSTLDFYRTAQPQLDLKPGQVARDLFVDGQAVQIARLYEELQRVKDAQSLFLSLGSDLDANASNFGASRKQGSKSTGLALLTFNNIEADIPITKGSSCSASNGSSFTAVTSSTVSVANKNTYRATASKYRAALDFVGIDDEFATTILVEATSTGTAGNISKYSLKTTTIPGVSNITNPASFSGGSGTEIDSAFKRRILGIFSGANTGTATGYQNTVLADPGVVDAIVVSGGDPLMTRDGTQVYTAEDGTKTIISEGTGGKVDIYSYGFRLTEILDSYIYFDKSNKDDPTDIVNDFVLGQIVGDENKTVTRKRIDNLSKQILPDQPVTNIVEVVGSSSGANFKPKSTNAVGITTGNYELVFDTGSYAGSAWGFDRLRWLDDRIRDLPEDLTKGKFNSQDSTGYSDVTKISTIKQNIQIINENGRVLPTDRSSIQLAHYPITAVSRVFNQTTGERYVVANQNPDGGSKNTTGRIIISGSTLPAVSDILQIDYIWLFDYDSNWDYDNRENSENIRSSVDSIDWGYSNNILREEVITTNSGSQIILDVSHSINSVVSVNTFTTESDANVTSVSNQLAVYVTEAVINVISIIRNSDNAELYNTGTKDGGFSGYAIYLPTDTIAKETDTVTVKYNSNDKFTINGISGSFNGTTITLPTSTDIADGYVVEVNYLADIRQLLPAVSLSNLPVTRDGNAFKNNLTTNFGSQPTTHIYSSGTIIERNLRRAPSRLKLTIAGTISPGVITISGTSIQGIFNGVFIASANGLVHDLSSLIRKSLGLTSNQTIPSNIGIVRLISFEKVQTTTNKEVVSVLQKYDVFGYELKHNDLVKREALENSNLTVNQIKLPSTITNNDHSPKIGDAFRVTFYIGGSPAIESISFSKSGSLYTQKIFAFIDSVSISSGFTSGASQTATLTIIPQNQPVQGSRYTSYYDYIAPKPNERISIKYNKNQVITDTTFAIERTRPIGSDVLVKATIPILVDITLYIVVVKGFENSSNVVAQNVKDAVTTALNANNLGTIVDESDFTTIANGVNGVDRVRSTRFNKSHIIGRVLSITAQKNEYIQANNVLVYTEER
jgi:hypothetical protein